MAVNLGSEPPTPPQALTARPEGIPAELKAIPRWVTWRYLPAKDPGNGHALVLVLGYNEAMSSAPPAPAPPPPPTIHEAECASGASGAVLRGAAIDFAAAVARRRAGQDVVVCGDDGRANRRAARDIESVVGPCQRQDPHRRAGPLALPHYQQAPRQPSPPGGHTFYETPHRKARKGP